jgi:hypothetical protein
MLQHICTPASNKIAVAVVGLMKTTSWATAKPCQHHLQGFADPSAFQQQQVKSALRCQAGNGLDQVKPQAAADAAVLQLYQLLM